MTGKTAVTAYIARQQRNEANARVGKTAGRSSPLMSRTYFIGEKLQILEKHNAHIQPRGPNDRLGFMGSFNFLCRENCNMVSL